MEENLSLMEEMMGLSAISAESQNNLTLAYLGDAVYELIVRSYMLSHGAVKAEALHKRVTAAVNAGAQSRLIRILEPMLSEEEAGVYRRARNAKVNSVAKNQSVADYHRATGLEALIGYLYLKREYDRIALLLEEGLQKLFPEENGLQDQS